MKAKAVQTHDGETVEAYEDEGTMRPYSVEPWLATLDRYGYAEGVKLA